MYIWDIIKGNCIKKIFGHVGWIWSVKFSPCKNFLITASNDGVIKIWNVKNFELVKSYSPDRPYERMNIRKVSGLTEAQIMSLKTLGAID